MAVNGRSAEQKAALAKIVSRETLDDIEEYIRPHFPPKGLDWSSVDGSLPSLTLASRRHIVQDGHGRWREVRPINIYSKSLQNYWSPDLKGKHKSLVAAKTKRSNLSKRPNASDRSFRITEYYDNLSMALRSNVFPGLGNNEWNSTTANVFTEKYVSPLTQGETFFGIQTDEHGKWSAANVLHERMKKKWNDYLDTLPNLQAERIDQATKLMMKKTDGPAPTKERKKTLKAHKKKLKKPSSEGPTNMIPQEIVVLPSPLSIDNVADNNDDNFWDFYDKPFNKPI